ncbi:MAG: NAD(P)H-dependent glycerol-3-phosphate dehydrogenase [Ferruginibacter sp.]
MQLGILGNGSWGTALAKLLTDNGQNINWWNRSESAINTIKLSKRNPQYLPSAHFDVSKLSLSTDISKVIKNSDAVVIAIPSAFAELVLNKLDKDIFKGKIIISAIKGILPGENLLLNDYLKDKFDVQLENYYTVMGPCHAEEVAAKKLSYLTFSGLDEISTREVASKFKTDYLRTIINNDIYGVQYAAVLKNIYAIGSGIAHGLNYGDNFLSVLIANSADEMAVLLRKAGILNAEVGYIEHGESNLNGMHTNYAASVYLGDLLVTCYSVHSRNRTFGGMVGKGYSVEAAQSEMKMVAEGYNASKCMHILNEKIGAEIPIANTIYEILWNNLEAAEGFKRIENCLL